MVSFFEKLFSADFMPHGHCYAWRPEIVWLHVLSDGFIGLAYFSIPLMLLHFTRRRTDLPFSRMFLMFAAFIIWCGTTHFLNIVTLWIPVYRLDGVVKAITAGISVITAGMLFPLIPQALSLKSPRELEAKNRELEVEIDKRQQAQLELAKTHQELKQVNNDLERRVAARTSELAKSNKELENFAYIASHDLKEPLRMVSLYVQMLEEKTRGKLDADEQEYMKFACEGAERMTKLIDAVLSYSRVGKDELVPEPVNTRSLVDEILQTLDLEIQEKSAKVTVENLPTITADEILIGRVFQNLISNAIKFRKENDPRVWISSKDDGEKLTFSVRDNGIGLAPQYRDRIFTIFQRLHSREEYPGAGIGLAVCKKIIELHGGQIWVESEPGEGSTFSFTIPKREFEERRPS